MGMSFASPMSEFLYGAARRIVSVCVCTNGKEDANEGLGRGKVGGRRSLLRSDVVRNTDARRAGEYVFANVGAVLKPPLMKLFRSPDRGKVWDGEVKRGDDGRQASSEHVGKIAARLQELLEKLIIFPVS